MNLTFKIYLIGSTLSNSRACKGRAWTSYSGDKYVRCSESKTLSGSWDCSWSRSSVGKIYKSSTRRRK
jgi:hypothetical protein